MEIKYFKLRDNYQVILPDNVKALLNKDTIFHIQTQYNSAVTGDDMVVIAIDKCTPISVPINAGVVLN